MSGKHHPTCQWEALTISGEPFSLGMKLFLCQPYVCPKWSHCFLGSPPLQDLPQPQHETVLSE